MRVQVSPTGPEDLEIPDRATALAAEWLVGKKITTEELEQIAANGGTCLFWFFAGMLAEYKSYV